MNRLIYGIVSFHSAIYLPGSGPPTFQIFGTQKYTQMARFPFNSELQRMSVVMK